MNFEPGQIVVLSMNSAGEEIRRPIIKVEGERIYYTKPDGEHWIGVGSLERIMSMYAGRIEEADQIETPS